MESFPSQSQVDIIIDIPEQINNQNLMCLSLDRGIDYWVTYKFDFSISL